MKASAEKSSSTVSRTTASRPFFAKAGGGDFFAPVNRPRGKSVAKGGSSTPNTALKANGKSNVSQYLTAKGAPVLQKGIGLLQTLKKNEQTHDDDAEKMTQAEKSVVIPPSEGQSKSNAGQVNVVSERPAPPADAGKAQRKLQESLKANIPKTIEQVDNFKRDMKAQHMSADVMQVVEGDKTAVVSTFNEMEQAPPPAPPEHAPESLPSEEIAPATANMNLGQGAVASLQKEHTDVSNYTNEADSKLKEEEVTQEQLDMVDSGDLAEANKEKKGMEKSAKTEPVAVQAFVQQAASKVDQELRQEEKKERDGMKSKRKAGLGATAQKQKSAKGALEKKREEVASKINGIYTKAQSSVKKKLADLETVAMRRFDDGNATAAKTFEDNVKREIDIFKKERYSGILGRGKKIKDWLLGMDELPEVKNIFDRNRTAFVSTINQLIETISADNKRVIQECKDELANAKKEIKDYVDKLGPDLKDIGQKTAEEMNAKLAEIDQFIAKREQELQDKLKDKQQAAIKAIDEKIEKMKEAMSGALAKFGKLMLLAAKKFFTWALEKAGFSLAEIEGVINKGAAVLKAIFTKPIQFVKNLMNAAITGFNNFGKNFLPKHLKNSLFEWLTGAIEGLVLPQTWDFKGIVSVALQMIGISYQNLRKHMVAVMGENVVAGLEKTFTLVKTLVTEGPMAAWEQLREMAGETQTTFIEAVKDFIKVKIIEQAIQWVASIFIPGAGIVKAIIGIYDTVMFFIQKAKQIMQMVGNFLGSIAAIAAGNIGAAADALENGLARGLTLVISFLAQLLRLGGITKKIQGAIQKIRGKVDAVLAKVAKWIGDKAGKLLSTVKAGIKNVLGWWKREQKFSVDGEQHRFFFTGDANSAQLRVASDEKSLEDFLASVPDHIKKKKSFTIVSKAQAKIVTLRNNRKPPKPDAADPIVDPQIEAQLTVIADNLPDLFSGGSWGTNANPLLLVYPKKSALLYRPLYLGPQVDGRMTQSMLKSRFSSTSGTPSTSFRKDTKIKPTGTALDTWIAKGGTVQEFKPFEQKLWPDGGIHGGSPTLGIAPKYLVQVGTSFNYEKGTTPGGKKINDALKKFGYYGRKIGGENSDGDHVLEAQLIGAANADQVSNMWPLDKTENRHGENLETQASVEVSGQPALKFKGVKAAVESIDSKKTKSSKGMRIMIKNTVDM